MPELGVMRVSERSALWMLLIMVRIRSPIAAVIRGNSTACDKEHWDCRRRSDWKKLFPLLTSSNDVEIYPR